MKKRFKTGIFLSLFVFTSSLLFAETEEVRMNRVEKDIFKQELDPMNDDPANLSGLKVWNHFFYNAASPYIFPQNDNNGLSSIHGHETQGVASVYEFDENGKIIPENWVLIKNGYVDVHDIDGDNFFKVLNKKNIFSNDDEELGDGDFFYDGYFQYNKTILAPGKSELYVWSRTFNHIQQNSWEQVFTVSERTDYNGTEINWNNTKGWSYLTVFPKTGMIFKPSNRITKIEGNTIVLNEGRIGLARRIQIELKALKKENGILAEDKIQQDNNKYWIQGGAFSPNGRFFYNVHDGNPNDSQADMAPYTGVYIYYVPEFSFRKIIYARNWAVNDQIDLDFYLVGFIHIPEEMLPQDTGCAAVRNMELEGIDIFPASDNGDEYDIHVLFLNNECGDEEMHSIYHYESGDYDQDGIKDVYDNCPFDRNEDQADRDGNGLGDICDHYDPDGDNVFEDDNCPGIYNPDQGDYDGDGVGDLCDPCPSNGMVFEYETRQDSDGDGTHDECDNCPDVRNYFEPAKLNNELISAKIQECDENDDNFGCVLKTYFSGGAVENAATKNNGYYSEIPVYSAGMINIKMKAWYWQPDHDLDGVGDACDTDQSSVTKLISTTSSNPLFFRGKSEVNKFVDLNYKVIGDTTPKSTAKYCWLDNLGMNRWGQAGYCTTSDLGKNIPTINDSSFGYSHGGDPEPYNRQLNKLAWQTPKISSFMGKISVTNKAKDSKSVIEKWDWTKNLYVDYNDLYETYVSSGQQDLKEPFINYAASVGLAGTEDCSADEDYYNEETEFVNPACFRNMYLNARTKRENKLGTKLGYYTENLENNYFSKLIDSGMLSVPDKSLKTCSGCLKYAEAGKGVAELWNYKNNILASDFRKLSSTGDMIAAFNDEESIISIFEGDNEIYFGINDEDNPAEIILAGIAPKPSENLIKGKGAIVRGKIYLAGQNMLYALEKDNGGQQSVGNELRYKFTEVMQLPYPVETVSFFGINNEFVMLHDNGSYYEAYGFESGRFEEIVSDEHPVSRDSFSFSADKWKLYFAGGATDGRNGVAVHSDVWALDPDYGWRKIAGNVNIDMADVLIKEENGMLNIFSRTFPEKEVATAFVNIATGDIDYGKTALENDLNSMDEEKYCIGRAENNPYPGKEFRNRCAAVEDYQFKSYTFLDYKFSLAGTDDFVFSGGLSGIRTFKINALGGLENGDLDVIGIVNSLAVKGNTLYASRSNRIFVFEVKENGDLVKRKEISASGCDQIRVSGNMLFTGENGKVNIYDITDSFNPVKKYTVSLSMNVVDLEVWNEYLFVFHDKWFSSSKLAMFKLSENGSASKKDEIKLSCDDPEFISDSQNVYLGCRNGQKKIELNESEKLVIKSIGGSKNYFRDTYLRNGIIYTVHSGRIFLSK